MDGGVLIGLSNVVYSLLNADPSSGLATYETAVRVPGAISAKVNPNSSMDTLFAEDGPFETASTIGQISVELNVADLNLDTQAAFLGHSVAGGILIRKGSDVPPWIALGFKTLKTNGKYRYTWLAKGKFSAPQQDNQTKGDKIQFQTPTITGSFVQRDCDAEWQRHIDQDHIDYMPIMGANWFNDPYGGAPDVDAPTVTIVPADAAAAVVVGSSVTWTFNEAIALSTATKDNFTVVKDSDGSAVAGSLSINGARTVVTFAPTGNLAAATAYRAIVTTAVTDLAGNHLAATKVTKFTTA